MERKLERRDIARYLPYGLKIQNGKEYDDVTGCDMEKVYSVFRGHLYNESEFKDVKPILYPVDSLYKTIPHNGKEIMPILELAKIEWTGIEDIGYKLNEDLKILETPNYKFWFNEFSRSFIKLFNYPRKVYGVVSKQCNLFDYLNELKIDYRGLIDSGLAISVYNLDTNLYK